MDWYVIYCFHLKTKQYYNILLINRTIIRYNKYTYEPLKAAVASLDLSSGGAHFVQTAWAQGNVTPLKMSGLIKIND